MERRGAREEGRAEADAAEPHGRARPEEKWDQALPTAVSSPGPAAPQPAPCAQVLPTSTPGALHANPLQLQL